jgi:4-alpha-glucanotransferase
VDLGAWGVDAGYWDVSGHWHEAPPDTLDAVGQAMGVAGDDAQPPSGPPIWFVRAGTVEYLQGPADLVLEDGATVRATEALPPDLTPGYHRLVPLDGGPATTLVVTPGRCHLPHDLRTWGWATQLYAARSRASWGIGDLADLRTLGAWASANGAGVMAVSPLHAPGPSGSPEPSPYYPSSRRFRSPLHLRVEEVPGAAEVDGLERAAAAGVALNIRRHIDRAAVWAVKRPALEAAFQISGSDPDVDRYRRRSKPSVVQWATYCAIADVHGNDWRQWPPELRHPGSAAVASFATRHADPVRFHVWLQWALDRQLTAAGAACPVLQDLAVGFDPGGADAWGFQDSLALDMRIGAPPDDFNRDGQDWGLPPFVPWRLRADGYRPFIETLRAAFDHAGGLRIDHVMGLFRLFWVPPGVGPGAGTYVRYPAGELLDILALESYRAGAWVVGEDLGTVEDSVRAELHERHVLSYRLLWFEPGPPSTWPSQAVAAVTTHDLPTIAGLWTGADPATAEMTEVRGRLQSATGLHDEAAVDDVIVGAHRALAESHSRVLLATLEDAASVTERPNTPGTVDERNWSTALPMPIEDLMASPRAHAIGDALSHRS